VKDAKKEVNKNASKDFEGMLDYIKNIVYPALLQREQGIKAI